MSKERPKSSLYGKPDRLKHWQEFFKLPEESTDEQIVKARYALLDERMKAMYAGRLKDLEDNKT